MGFTTRIDHERREIYATAEGSITLEDIRQHLLEGQNEGVLTYPEVYDARKAEPHFSVGRRPRGRGHDAHVEQGERLEAAVR